MSELKRKKILVAPLNWGLGHASRCIVIVKFLQENNFEPVIASDGDALVFFRKEFPNLSYIELPSYRIKYAKNGTFLKWKLLYSFFSIRSAVYEENRIVNEVLNTDGYVGVISDNRFGVYHKKLPSVYITHQLNVLSGFTTNFSSWFHQRIISKFDECWVPDFYDELSLAGRLSQAKTKLRVPLKKIGALSRLERKELPKKYDILVLLSGPEPQRTLLENILIKELETYEGLVAFVRGKVNATDFISVSNNTSVFNYLLSCELEEIMNQSDLVISRSGYSTIMDLCKLEKKAFFIPTPGQPEQAYLAKLMKEKKYAPSSSQDKFKIDLIEETKNYLGFNNDIAPLSLNKDLLAVFKKKG